MTTATRTPTAAAMRAWWLANDWDRLAPVLNATARRAVQRYRPDADTLDDVAQQTVVRCWGVDVVPAHPGHFAAVVARNVFRDRCKAQARRPEVTGPLGARTMAAFADDAPDALAHLIATADGEQLRAAVRTLPDAMRRPLVLQVFHGRSVAALALQFGTTADAMKMRLYRARQRLAVAYHRLEERHPTLSVHARLAGYFDIGTARLFDIPLAPSRFTQGSR
jgi:RNA polymerase sigma factor (sigma-70 family)